MKRLHLTVFVTSIGDTSILVPDNMSRDEALQYAKEHLHEVSLPGNLDPDQGSMTLDEDNCDFDEDDDCDLEADDEPWQTCQQKGYCTVLGKHSSPTVFDCDRHCPNRPH